MFGEIRSLVQNKPSEQGWEELCHLISEWQGPEDLDTIVIPYIMSHLQEWPHAMRRTPLRWKEGLVRGAQLPFGKLVKVLDGSHLGLRNEDLLTLARAPVVPHIEALDLSHNLFGWRGLMHLFRHAPDMTRWRALNLDHTGVGVEGLRLLAETPDLKHIETLSLAHVQTSPEGIAVLMRSEHLHALHTLILSRNGLTERHIAALVEGERFNQLTTLLLDGNPIGSRGLIHLFHRNKTRHLTHLDLSDCGLTAPAGSMLVQSRALPNLKVLRLAHNPLVRRSEVFAQLTQLPALRALDLRGEQGEERRSIAQLLEQGRFERLDTLCISKRAYDERLHALAIQNDIRLVHMLPIEIAMLGPR